MKNIILRAQYCFPSIALSNVALRNEISGYFFLTVKKKKKKILESNFLKYVGFCAGRTIWNRYSLQAFVLNKIGSRAFLIHVQRC